MDEPALASRLGLEYVNVPVSGGSLTDQTIERVLGVLRGAGDRTVFVHCGSGSRVGGALLPYLMLDHSSVRRTRSGRPCESDSEARNCWNGVWSTPGRKDKGPRNRSSGGLFADLPPAHTAAASVTTAAASYYRPATSRPPLSHRHHRLLHSLRTGPRHRSTRALRALPLPTHDNAWAARRGHHRTTGGPRGPVPDGSRRDGHGGPEFQLAAGWAGSDSSAHDRSPGEPRAQPAPAWQPRTAAEHPADDRSPGEPRGRTCTGRAVLGPLPNIRLTSIARRAPGPTCTGRAASDRCRASGSLESSRLNPPAIDRRLDLLVRWLNRHARPVGDSSCSQDPQPAGHRTARRRAARSPARVRASLEGHTPCLPPGGTHRVGRGGPRR